MQRKTQTYLGDIDNISNLFKKTTNSLIKQYKKIAIIVSTVIGLTILLLSTQILNLYTDSDNVKSIIKSVLIMLVVAQYAQNIRDVYAGGLRGVGDTKYIAKYTILTNVLLKKFLSYVCVNILKLDLISVWSVIAIQEFIKAIIFCKRFNSEKWKDIRVINNIDRERIS